MEIITQTIVIIFLVCIIISLDNLNKKYTRMLHNYDSINQKLDLYERSKEFDSYHKKIVEYMKAHCEENVNYEVRLLAHKEKKEDEKVFTIDIDEIKGEEK